MVLIKIETLLLTNNSVFHVLGGDETSFIKDFNTKKVLGLENSATIDGTDVIIDLEDKFESMSEKWVLVPYFGVPDAEGNEWFMVKNILAERFLTAGDSKDLKIRGMYCRYKYYYVLCTLKTKLLLKSILLKVIPFSFCCLE